jgi:hypothetical protein
MATFLQFPIAGWGVRAGGAAAHCFVRAGRLSTAICGSVERADLYVPQALRPLQVNKRRCSACERALDGTGSRPRQTTADSRPTIKGTTP